MKNLLAYLVSKMFWKNFALAIGLALTFFIILFLFLRIYTHHGESISVPDVSDLPVEDAARILEERDMRYEVFDSLYVAEKERGVIIDQHPKAGKAVKKNRKIYLTINATSPEKILMPELVGRTLREARMQLEIAGLEMGSISYRFHIAENVVLAQQLNAKEIEPNDTILKGTKIDLVLGKGLSNERRTAPDLIGLSEDEATTKAADALFTIHSAIPDNTVVEGDTLIPLVFRQEPSHSPNVLVPLGTEIIIWLTTDSAKLPQADTLPEPPVWPELNEYEDDENLDDTYNDYDYNDN